MFDNNPGTGGGDFNVSEYEFYKAVKKNNSFATLTGREQQAYMLLQNKVAMYGEGSLNKNGWGWSSSVQTPYGGINEGKSASEPFLVNTLSEAVKRSGNSRSSFKPLAGQPGLYMTTNKLGHNDYYFTKFEEQSKKKTPPPPPPIIKPKPPKVTYKSLGKKEKKVNTDRPTALPKVKSEYDLLFNTLDYATTYDAELQQMAMDLIFAGDDLLDNFNYQSIDYLPDYDIEMKTERGDYEDAALVLKSKGLIQDVVKAPNNTPKAQTNTPVIDENIQLANELLLLIQKEIQRGSSYSKLIKHFGNFDGKTFVGGVANNGTIDFVYEIPAKFKGIEVQIHFDPI